MIIQVSHCGMDMVNGSDKYEDRMQETKACKIPLLNKREF